MSSDAKPRPPAATGVDGGPRLLDRVRAELRLRHYSVRTEQAYVTWVLRSVSWGSTPGHDG